VTQYSLAQLTVLEASPPELIKIAAHAGYDLVGLRLLEVTGGDAWPLTIDKHLRRSTKEALRYFGLGVLDVELVRLTPDVDVSTLRPTIEVAADLGARHILTQAHDDEWGRLCDNFDRLCDLLAGYGLTADLEFLTWTKMKGVNDVLRLLEKVDKTNVGVTVDTLHFYRSGCLLDDLQRVPPELLHFVQVSDAPACAPSSTEGLIRAARGERLNPGEGELDLLGLFRTLPENIPVAVEIPNTGLASRMPVEQRVRDALDATKALVASARRVQSSSISPVQ
jgi:sugar phosphate isomerase/epimerase